MSPTAMTFLIVGALGLIGIILVLIFDRPKRPKGTPDQGQEHPKEVSHRL